MPKRNRRNRQTKIRLEAELLAKRLRNPRYPMKKLSREALRFLSWPKVWYNQAPYGLIIRDALMVGKAGIGGTKKCHIRWKKTFPRVQRLVRDAKKQGTSFAKTVLCESIAHRYYDLSHSTRIKYPEDSAKYLEKAKKHYLLAHSYALQGGHTKNIDSSLYWLGIMLLKVNKKDEANYYFCKVGFRTGKKHKERFFKKKVRWARRKCDCARLSEKQRKEVGCA